MKKFMAIYTGTPAGRAEWERLGEEQRNGRLAAGMRAWQEWGATHRNAIVDGGGPLGKTKRASKQGISETRNNMSAYVIVQAESHDEAARMFENHPQFTIFPGDGVEIMEVMPVPGQ
jgi:hypothetical protein